METVQIDGNKVDKVYQAIQEIKGKQRVKPEPFLVKLSHLECVVMKKLQVRNIILTDCRKNGVKNPITHLKKRY